MAEKRTRRKMTEADKIKRTDAYKNIKKSLMQHLIMTGNNKPQFQSLIEDYMQLYITKEMCKRDIEARGVTFTAVGSAGQSIVKKNENVDTMLKINQQMIKILDSLEIKADNNGAEDEEM